MIKRQAHRKLPRGKECECVGESDGISCVPKNSRHNISFDCGPRTCAPGINMQRLIGLLLILGLGAAVTANAAEYNPVRNAPVSIGPQMSRIIVGFRATSANSVVQSVQPRNRSQSVQIVQARTTAADVTGLATRTGLSMARSQQVTSGMHVMFLKQTLYGADVADALAKLRADPAVEFADIDQR